MKKNAFKTPSEFLSSSAQKLNLEGVMNPIPFRFDNERITNHGGFELFNRYADISLNLSSSIEKHIDIVKRKATFSVADLTYRLINLNILFPFRISQLDYIKSDDYLKEKFSVQSHSDSDTFRRHLLKFSRKNLTDIKRLIKDLLGLDKLKKKMAKLKRITIDIDSSLFEAYGHQQGVACSYMTSKTGNKYFNVLFGFIYELDLLVNLSLRNGSAYTGRSAVHFVKQILLIIPKEFHHKIVVRADSGYFDEKLLLFFEKHNIGCVIKAKSYGSFDELIRKLDHRIFAPKGQTVQFARTDFKLHSWKKARTFLVIKKRITVKNPKELENKSQLQLPFKIKDYYYNYSFIVATGSELVNRQLFKYYCQRGASENFIKEYKNGFGGTDVASEKMIANYANMLLKAVSYNIVSLFKLFVLENKFQRKTIETLRYFIIYVPGKLVKRGQKMCLSLIDNYLFQDNFSQWEKNIVPL